MHRSHIVFDDRAVAVHQGDGVAAGALDVVVLDAHVGGTVLRDEAHHLFVFLVHASLVP